MRRSENVQDRWQCYLKRRKQTDGVGEEGRTWQQAWIRIATEEMESGLSSFVQVCTM